MLGHLMPLPSLTGVRLNVVEELTPPGLDGFLAFRRRRMSVTYPDGEESEPFVYDAVDRQALDAVVVVAHHRTEGGRHVYLRSAIRPPLTMRAPEQRPFPEASTLGELWEVVAGLVERSECSVPGLVRCARRELEEELGFAVPEDRIHALGRSTFPSPGVIGERHHYFHVEVDPQKRGTPTEDGSVLEQRAQIVSIPLDEAIDLTRRGVIEDAKTELALRRLEELP